MKIILTIFVTVITSSISLAGTWDLDTLSREKAYVSTILERAKKVTDSLNITGSDKAEKVRNIVANRYFQLSDIYAERDSLKNEAENLEEIEKTKALLEIENLKDSRLYRTHFDFIANLSVLLSEDEIETVKDVMTYNVVKVTFEAQCDMIPQLTQEEKIQILSWLKEAREYAIDEESSKKKHEVFGKYKGRINNFLTARGYNLQKERQAWEERVKARGGTL